MTPNSVRERIWTCLVIPHNLPNPYILLLGVKVDLPVLLEKDKDDILNFGLVQGIDMIALSFTQHPNDVLFVRELMGVKGKHVKIICKIENQEGLKNYEDILKVADGIMVARGDLGMEIPP